MTTNSIDTASGTFAAPRYYLDKSRPEYRPVRELFERLQWSQPNPRRDFIENRFNAFCSILGAVRSDPQNVVHTLLNKSHYDVSKWPIPYLAMKDVMGALVANAWLERIGERRLNRNYRFQAPPKSPLLGMSVRTVKLSPLYWEPPIVSIRRGKTDLDKAPLDVELMANPKWKAWIAKHLIPPMESLNEKLIDHQFVLFPNGRADDWVQPQYHRIYTNVAGFKEEPSLLHGRIYPRNFRLPSKKQGWRQMTLIDGQRTREVDVHASSLTLLSNDFYLGFDLPETDDYYQFGPLKELNRELVKTVVQVLINGVSHDRKTWPTSITNDETKAALISGKLWQDYAEPLVSTYPTLAQVKPNMGLELMWVESTIILGAMNNLLDKGIGCLSLHDCLIVPEANVEDAKMAFVSAYESRGFKPPLLRVS